MRYVYVTLGFILLGLGMLGVFLPVVPATPFLLGASFCFSKGSRRFHTWFCGTKIYKNHLESFVKSRAMKLRSKITILAFASTMLVLSFIFMQNWIGRTAIILVMIAKYSYFIFGIKTIVESEKELIFP
ncbi:YbaN family protein [Paenibacillus sp. N1-5-1-14]|uniref:YbaN family protein n=1 Tax=Paenibacillus radicibacter TaxID=2972488 RepID=UPI0021598684|nr:YbaN family protein [Paenibacillus radicibacter]MCR8644401.1 YbaN family protein [Paenibacillus radicibacter]